MKSVPSVTTTLSTPGNEKLAMNDRAALRVNIRRVVVPYVFKPLWRQIIAELFMHLPDDALQVRLAVFAVAAEEANLPGTHNVTYIVSLLEQKTTERVDKNCASEISIAYQSHRPNRDDTYMTSPSQ